MRNPLLWTGTQEVYLASHFKLSCVTNRAPYFHRLGQLVWKRVTQFFDAYNLFCCIAPRETSPVAIDGSLYRRVSRSRRGK